MWSLRRALANRVIRSTTPQPPLRERLRLWAERHAAANVKEAARARVTNYLDILAAEATLQREAQRQTVPFPILNQLGHGQRPGLRALPKPTPYNLRRFSEAPPTRRGISKIKSGITPLKWQVKPRDGVLPEGKEKDPPAEMVKRIKSVENAMRRPNETDTWRSFLEQVTEDTLCGYGSVEIQPQKDPERPFRLWPVDGASVRINLAWTSDDDDNPETNYRYTQAMAYSGAAAAALEPVLLKDREIIYLRMHPRAHSPWGFGAVECAFSMINAFLGAFEARERKESNEIPDIWIDLGPDASPQAVEDFRFYWENYIEGYGKVPISGGHDQPQMISLRGEKLVDLQWPEFIIRMIANSFNLAPQSFGLERDVNRNTSSVMSDAEFVDACIPIISILEDCFTQGILEKVLGYDDLEIRAIVTDSDKATQAQIVHVYVTDDLVTVDEAREMLGIDPRNDDRGAMTISELRAHVQAEAMQAVQPPGGPEDRLALENGQPQPDDDGPPQQRRGLKPGQRGPGANPFSPKLGKKPASPALAKLRRQVAQATQSGWSDRKLLTLRSSNGISAALEEAFDPLNDNFEDLDA